MLWPNLLFCRILDSSQENLQIRSGIYEIEVKAWPIKGFDGFQTQLPLRLGLDLISTSPHLGLGLESQTMVLLVTLHWHGNCYMFCYVALGTVV